MKTLLAGLDPTVTTSVVAPLTARLGEVVTTNRVAELTAILARERPDLVLLPATGAVPPQWVADLRRRWPRVEIVAVAPAMSPQLTAWADAANCSDIVLGTAGPDELRRCLDDLTRRGAFTRGDSVALIGAKGGVGTTAVAIHLAAAVAGRVPRALLTDLHLYLGDVAHRLGLTPNPSVLWAIHGRTALHYPALPSTRAGLHVLGLDADVEAMEPVGADQVADLVNKLTAIASWTAFDLGASLTEEGLAAAATAERVLLVTTEEATALDGAQRRLVALRRVVRHPDAIGVLLNRATGRVDVGAIEQRLGVRVFASIRNDWATAQRAIDAQAAWTTCAPDTEVAQDVEHLADALVGPRPAPSAEAPTGWRARWGLAR